MVSSPYGLKDVPRAKIEDGDGADNTEKLSVLNLVSQRKTSQRKLRRQRSVRLVVGQLQRSCLPGENGSAES
jgi:hypothetical protein